MLNGQPCCRACGYEGPDFMWTWHPFRGFWALVQDRLSLDLRVVEVPDDEVFYSRNGRTDAERAAYVTAAVARQLRPGERHVPPSKFGRFEPDDEAEYVTELPCPKCRFLLFWRPTGIT